MRQNKDGHYEDLDPPGLVKRSEEISYLSRDLYSQTIFQKNMAYFHIMGHEESHSVRRREILGKHPEISILFGTDITSAWFGIMFVTVQMFCLNYLQHTSWPIFLISAYVIGATISHALHVLVHDLTHFTCFESVQFNKFLAIFANFGQGIPSAITFGRYHSDHHTFMNLEYLDPDLPSRWELKVVKGPFMKLLFLIFLPFFYGIRPIVLRPLKPNGYEILNTVSVFIVDYLIYQYIGAYGLLWLIVSTMFGMSLHPFAAHFIAEHYEFINRMETYDYIGWANFFILNIGYHTEHHDFPMIPWTRLPLLRKMAPEYYETLPVHTNYLMTLWAYIFDVSIGPFSRISRNLYRVPVQNGSKSKINGKI